MIQQKLKKVLRNRMKTIPPVFNLLTNWEYQIERDLIAGCHQTVNTHRSIIHFSMNKAATQYVKSILSRCARENGIIHARIHDYAFDSNFPYLDSLSWQEMERYRHIFQPKGYLYSVFGGMIANISNLEDYHIVLMVRDPRDILTSSYYSIGYSHQLPEGENKITSFMEKRNLAQTATIDEYVLAEKESVLQTYQRYLDLLVYKANVHVTKYEEMIGDFSTWLDNLLEYCNLKITPQLKQKLIDEAKNSRPTKEKISKHRRQVIPGNYKNKLKTKTIEQLNAYFADVLAEFAYI